MVSIVQYNQAVDDWSDGIYRFILKNVRDTDLAKDMVQDTFEKFWIKRDNVDAEKIKSYLFTTAFHLVIDHTRRQKFKGDVKEISNTPSHTPNYNNAQEILEQLVNELPEIQKAVIMLRDYEGYSYQEIAEITSLNESQVKVYIFRARKYLKERIGSMEVLI